MDYEPHHGSMVLFQKQRQLELQRYAHGDRTVEGPATPLKDNWWMPEPPKLNPMADAPRDGSTIRLHRRPHVNTRFLEVNAHWSRVTKCWIGRHHLVIRDDENLLGWLPA